MCRRFSIFEVLCSIDYHSREFVCQTWEICRLLCGTKKANGMGCRKMEYIVMRHVIWGVLFSYDQNYVCAKLEVLCFDEQKKCFVVNVRKLFFLRIS